MSWSSARPWARRTVLALVALPLAGCGFHPLYAEREEAADEPALAAIHVLPIRDRVGQRLELSLREALNPSGLSVEPRFSLTVSLNVARIDLGIQRDASSTRGRVDAYALFTLQDLKGSRNLLSGSARSSSTFNILQDAYAAEVAEEDARARTVRDLTAEIRTRLALFLRERRNASS
jgi:LPS-assembly lipoprotein